MRQLNFVPSSSHSAKPAFTVIFFLLIVVIVKTRYHTHNAITFGDDMVQNLERVSAAQITCGCVFVFSQYMIVSQNTKYSYISFSWYVQVITNVQTLRAHKRCTKRKYG